MTRTTRSPKVRTTVAKYHAWTTSGAAHYIDTDQKLWIRETPDGVPFGGPTEITWVGPPPKVEVGRPLMALWVYGKDSEGNDKAFMRASTPVAYFERLDDDAVA